MLLHTVQNSANIHKITQNYFENNHGQCEGDSMHSVIERATAYCNEIMTPSQYATIIEQARKFGSRYSVKNCDVDDILDFATSMSSSIYVLEVRKNRPDAIFVKTTYISEFREVVLKRRESRRFSKLILSPTPYHCETIRLRSPKPNTRIWWRYAQDLILWYVIVTIIGFLRSFLIEML